MTRSSARFGFALALALSVIAVDRAQQPAPAGPSTTFTMALAGDSIITRKLSPYQEPAFLKLIEIIRGADAAFTNLEMLFHDYEFPAANQSGGTYMRAEPSLVKELVWAGFDLVSRANNHAGDYGVGAMRLTSKYVNEAGLIQAGVGDSLAEAREARFLDTAKARVALISVASTFTDHSRAGRTRGDMPARPGLNPLRFSTTYVVSQERVEALRAIAREIGASGQGQGQADAVTFMGRRFVAGDTPAVRTEPNKTDLDEIVGVVRNAARMADYVIVTIHTHESGKSRAFPPDFLVTFARAVVDAGASVFVGHGPHALRGIEIYKGRPIFYSIGDFIFQNETLLRYPSDNYEPQGLGPDAGPADFNDARSGNDRRGFPADREIWESVVAVPRWTGQRLAELKLHPISLGFGKGRLERGRPVLADAALAKKIIDDLVERSTPFGTTIAFENGIGVVRLAATSSQ